MSGKTTWLTGPTFLLKSCYKPEQVKSFNLAEPELDVEIRPEVGSYATHLKEKGINTEHFQRFSTFQTLVRAIALLIHIAWSHKSTNSQHKCKRWHICHLPRTPDELSQAKEVIIRKMHLERNSKLWK